MSTISIEDIEPRSCRLPARVENGETLVVTRDEHAVAEIKPIARAPLDPRPFGLCAGQFTVPDDFDEPLADSILGEFEGR